MLTGIVLALLVFFFIRGINTYALQVHAMMIGFYTRRVKMRAVGMGAKTKWYFWPNAAVREFVGLATEHRLKQAIIIGSMLATCIILTFVSYSSVPVG